MKSSLCFLLAGYFSLNVVVFVSVVDAASLAVAVLGRRFYHHPTSAGNWPGVRGNFRPFQANGSLLGRWA